MIRRLNNHFRERTRVGYVRYMCETGTFKPALPEVKMYHYTVYRVMLRCQTSGLLE